jgi:hypothetical protein
MNLVTAEYLNTIYQICDLIFGQDIATYYALCHRCGWIKPASGADWAKALYHIHEQTCPYLTSTM